MRGHCKIIDTQLFMGGSADGRRIKTDGRAKWSVPLARYRAARAVKEGEDFNFKQVGAEDIYVREEFSCNLDGREFIYFFYRWEKMSLNTCVAALFGSYRGQ